MKALTTKPDDLSLSPRDPVGGRRALTFTLESACAYVKVTKLSEAAKQYLLWR